MGKYRIRDLVLVPNLLSLSRVPFGVAFVFVYERPELAASVLFMSGATDILDGWYARHFKQATPIGAVLDGITDKLFVTAVVGTLYFAGRLTLGDVALLSTRELGELPLVLWWAVSPTARQRKAETPRANALGKAATLFQFLCVAAVIVLGRAPAFLLIATAVLGAASALAYWRRELGAHG